MDDYITEEAWNSTIKICGRYFKMFFAEGEFEQLPERIKKDIVKFKKIDKIIYEENKKGKNVDKLIIKYTISSIEFYLKYDNELNKKTRNILLGGIGNIPITFFILDKIKIKKELKETISPLIDIVDSHANLHINRKKLILNVLRKLEQLKKSRGFR
ncbi:MAG: hypothetical protein AABW93_01325 [Nanoarchaeota archaeon]